MVEKFCTNPPQADASNLAIHMPQVHTPVLVNEALKYWVNNPEGLYVDLTLGLGGHAQALLEYYPKARVLGIEWDAESLRLAQERLKNYHQRVTLRHGNFAHLKEIFDSTGIRGADGFLFDLGPSSYQILSRGAGLTYQKDEPLDMRMGSSVYPFSAADLVSRLAPEELARLLTDLGEIPPNMARRFAAGIASLGSKKALQTTFDLTRALSQITANRKLWAQAFQALRVAVNHELGNLETLLKNLPGLCLKGARVTAISFHSLEDRMVKKSFQAGAKSGFWEILTPKPITASSEELSLNPKSRSAKLRAVLKQ